jgi:peptidyl-prolyl cis-trans isomerase B (cyclophilin B)
MLSIDPLPPEDAVIEIVLMDHSGGTLGRTSRPGAEPFDLAHLVPETWLLERAGFLQLLLDDAPSGPALVIQPLINRALVRTAEAMRPDGRTAYTRIIGWGDVLLDPENPEHVALKATWKPGEPTVMSGVRAYPERDVLLETTMGSILVALRPDDAPNTAWNFRQLAEGGFYDGTPFHRVVPFDRSGRPFVIQGGDPTGTGDGGPGWDLPLERSTLPHDFGVISMARADAPDSAGSQYFFALSREGTARLDSQYCAFGEAVDGAQTIVDISAVEIEDAASGRPVKMPVVTRASLRPAPARTPGSGRPDRRIERPAPQAESTGPDR